MSGQAIVMWDTRDNESDPVRGGVESRSRFPKNRDAEGERRAAAVIFLVPLGATQA